MHEKKIWRFLAGVLVATMFHNTAIVGILLYFSNFIRGKYEKALRKIIIGACIIVPLLFEQLISFAASYIAIFQKYTKFLGNGQEERLNTNFIYMLVMYGVIFLLYRFIKNAPVGNYWLATLALAQLSTYLLNNYIEWGFRMSYYFEISLFYCYGYVYKKLQYRTNRILFWMFSVGMIGFYFVYKFYIQGNCDVFPYTFVWTVSDL